ncbi:NAD-dependent epimerase/dehydratase family protein, partial [Pseudomonas aeruginosa]|uniref:NAD-dependent epimerase/dehydratase family protein n=2 Tax=Pseudomonas aeruginosa TaxID=287 RepID=UPI0026EE9734
MRVLVTGGAGFIGSHVLVELLGQGAKVVVLDNLVNGSSESLKRVECSGQPIPDSGLSFSSATAGGNPSLN